MISRGGMMWLALAVVAAVAAFTVKYEVRGLEERLAALEGEVASTREAIHVLRAEWSYLNSPERLADLARRHLDLVPMDAGQLGTLLDVPLKGAPEPGLLLDDEGNLLVTYKVEP